jgi:hypothetical protein
MFCPVVTPVMGADCESPNAPTLAAADSNCPSSVVKAVGGWLNQSGLFSGSYR